MVGQGYQQYEVGVSRRLRSGLEVTPVVRMTRTQPEAVAPYVETTADVTLAYPILGGRARNVALAAEEAAAGRVRAAEFDRVRAGEMAAAQVAQAYWSYVGAVRVREALAVAEQRSAQLLAETEALVAADERPAADLVVLRADLARRRASRLQAEQAVYETRQALGLAMGTSAERADALGRPADALPEVPEHVQVDEAALMEAAIAHRADLRAAEARVQSAERELHTRRVDRRPSVDIVVDAAHVALREGSIEPYGYLPAGFGSGAARGGQVGVSLRVNRLGSRAATAAVEQLLAERERLQISRDDLARRIRADVAAAVADLRSGAAEVAQTREAVALYSEAVEHEAKRLRLGMGTLFDMQTVEEHLANAQTEAVQAEVRYAQALVRLHVTIGTLSAGDAVAATARLRTIPRVE